MNETRTQSKMTSKSIRGKHPVKKCGFTIIELLVSIGIIAVLIALLLPSVQMMRESSRRMQCQYNLHQIGVAFQSYHDAHHQFPPVYVAVHKSVLPAFIGPAGDYDDPNIHTYGEFLLPYLDQAPLYNRINFQSPYFSPVDLTSIGLSRYSTNNQSITSSPLSVFLCPSSTNNTGNPFKYSWTLKGLSIPCTFGRSDYGPSNGVLRGSPLMNFALPHYSKIGDGALSDNQLNRSLSDVKDGSSSTALVWEIAGRPSVWQRGQLQPEVQTSGGGWADIAH